MKILSLSHSDINGGAARASFRIFEALHKSGVEIEMLVKYKESAHEKVLLADDFTKQGLAGQIDLFKTKVENRWYKWKIGNYNHRKDTFISNLSSVSLSEAFAKLDFDILHLHWISHQFLDLEELKYIKKPIVWTLHDCWAFTGICHYFDDCDNYRGACGSCNLLNSARDRDLSREIWEKKSRIYRQCNIHVVTPSKWLGESASRSSLLGRFPITVIPYPINTGKFKSVDKVLAKERLGLSRDRNYILYGAMNALDDVRKGFHFVRRVFELLPMGKHSNIELLILGSNVKELSNINGYRIRYLGSINQDTQLMDILSAADVVIAPSISENLSLMIMEAMACETPVVGFNIGGNPDLIDHKRNGYLAAPFSVEDLSHGMMWCLNENHNDRLSAEARKKVFNNFNEKRISAEYLKLYESL
ncbi:D-inositol-3-phosphate glycosyltransferase [Dyadobacter sp. CECT 9275]|uniref:D-inositol-3-phosphate glycosyltransferase n=1 Tax=Dyadobacter helix TaxID=2822344 RepID=A0A916JAJ3_9BACT|nr:glycosyltransferase family 4 protein [Dyadobacter sp. CECT 9275]CAG4999676.1 D-inositol-3-phosphate glycosyltransferase [Dyadobacter sp. CECT 9275]